MNDLENKIRRILNVDKDFEFDHQSIFRLLPNNDVLANASRAIAQAVIDYLSEP